MRDLYMIRRRGNDLWEGCLTLMDPVKPYSTPAEALEREVIYCKYPIKKSVHGLLRFSQGNIMRDRYMIRRCGNGFWEGCLALRIRSSHTVHSQKHWKGRSVIENILLKKVFRDYSVFCREI